ncbi:3-keto-5-aminohexanoate cleavage protein [Sulfitobacter sp. M22]|uniref:3-keto-5-aminohexanoate cleavage protein n=1 Tax=Sulfitobacter sp. M22 TaxID=2675332 RepID=UPI001F1F191F|nr:3-keto-5-aminohexanoate cleavage protein [Sulfitobacter sp. M22]MCF7728159.1 hypothetical protein [Sulfitobacter sp. M22]
MTKPCITCVAITGSLPRKANNPAVPITLAEQVEDTHEAFEAGASILHAHVRNDDENPPDLVDWLAAEMVEYDVKPEIEASPYVQFVMGVQNAMPVDGVVFDFYVQMFKRLFGEDAPWYVAGIGRHQVTLNEWAIDAGGHARTGLEDDVRLDKDRLAPSNAALVRRTAEICLANGCPVATQARSARVAGPAAHSRVRARVQPGRTPCAVF